MKLLLDSWVWGQAAAELQAAGHNVVWAGDWPQDSGDKAILTQAHAEERVLVTLDKDFGEMAIVHGHPHHGILRIVNCPARQQAAHAWPSSPHMALNWRREQLSRSKSEGCEWDPPWAAATKQISELR